MHNIRRNLWMYCSHADSRLPWREISYGFTQFGCGKYGTAFGCRLLIGCWSQLHMQDFKKAPIVRYQTVRHSIRPVPATHNAHLLICPSSAQPTSQERGFGGVWGFPRTQRSLNVPPGAGLRCLWNLRSFPPNRCPYSISNVEHKLFNTYTRIQLKFQYDQFSNANFQAQIPSRTTIFSYLNTTTKPSCLAILGALAPF